jgi:hypothetical protein
VVGELDARLSMYVSLAHLRIHSNCLKLRGDMHEFVWYDFPLWCSIAHCMYKFSMYNADVSTVDAEQFRRSRRITFLSDSTGTP